MIIMTFSAAMPILYVAGVLLCVATFWSSKFMFLRFYRSPPKHGLELAKRVRLLFEYGLVLHVICGMYMLTSSAVFIVPMRFMAGPSANIFDWMAFGASMIMKQVFGVNRYRLMSIHGIVYFYGSLLFIIMFIVQRFTGFFTRFLYWNCCCLKKTLQLKTMHSTDLYSDLLPDALRAEYEDVNLRLEKLQILDLPEDTDGEILTAVTEYQNHLEKKKENVKKALESAIANKIDSPAGQPTL